MFRKNFVSIVFTPSRIQVLLLNSKKDSVLVKGVFEIPQGSIVNHKVENPTQVAEVIKQAWQELRLAEKSAGLVVPEFSTYTKQLTLPQLDSEELTEAIKWQSQDFLPTTAEEMVMDWKIIGKKETTVDVLVTAIHKTVLSGYVDAVSQAGLYPLVVETPSLSLARLAQGQDESTKLLIYNSYEETILVISKGDSILASSVSKSGDTHEISATALRLSNHYENVDFQKVLVGGVQTDSQVSQSLSSSLGIPVEPMQIGMGGLEAHEIQEYLIGISLQLKDPAEPSDETTVNLLPPAWEKHYRDKVQGFEMWTISLISSFVIWASFLALIVVYMILGIQLQGFQKDKVNTSNTSESEVVTQAQEINALSSTIVKIQKLILSPDEVVNEINGLKPAGVSISNYTIDLEKGSVVLSGSATDRNALFAFKQVLDSSEKYTSVNLPLANITSGESIPFTVSFQISGAAPTQPPKLKLN